MPETIKYELHASEFMKAYRLWLDGAWYYVPIMQVHELKNDSSLTSLQKSDAIYQLKNAGKLEKVPSELIK